MKNVMLFFPLLLGLAACSPAPVTSLSSIAPITETPVPLSTDTPTPTFTPSSTPTPTETPTPDFHIGMIGITEQSQCDQLDMAKLQTQMPLLDAAHVKAWNEIGLQPTNVAPEAYNASFNAQEGAPWMRIMIGIYITDPRTISCEQIALLDGTKALAITVPLRMPGRNDIYPFTFVPEKNNPDFWQTLTAAIQSGKGITFDIQPWVYGNSVTNADWPVSSILMSMNDTILVFSPSHGYRIPTAEEVVEVPTSELLLYLIIQQDGTGIAPNSDLQTAILDELVRRHQAYPAATANVAVQP